PLLLPHHRPAVSPYTTLFRSLTRRLQRLRDHRLDASRTGMWHNPVDLIQFQSIAREERIDDASDRAARERVQFALRNVRSHKARSEDHTSELQSLAYLVCRLL